MQILAQFNAKMPTWALSYLINGDCSGLEDDEIKLVDDWQESLLDETVKNKDIAKAYIIYEPSEDEYFTHYPEFGKACTVVDCEVIIPKL